jgi:hypothetical protein
MRSRDVTAAQAIIDKHVLPEWWASEQAPQALRTLAQDIADVIQVARSANADKPRLIALRRQEITKTLGICRASIYRVLEAAE